MPPREESDFSKFFHSQMHEIRSRIATLPDSCREMLHSFANNVEEQHCRMQNGCANVKDLVDDLSLNVKAARFNLWASQIDGKSRKQGGF